MSATGGSCETRARIASTSPGWSSRGSGVKWNRFIAVWFEGGKDDPKLALLRLDAERAEIWVDASSLVAGIKLLLGADPKKDQKNKVAEVELR